MASAFIDPTDPRWTPESTVTYAFGQITDPTQQALITQAFGTWAAATGLHFQQLSSNAEPGGQPSADITFGYANNNAAYGTLGETSLSFANGLINSGVQINLQDPGDTELAQANGQLSYIRPGEAPQNHTTFEQLALHEIGHALGFNVDSGDPQSIESIFLTQANLGLDQTDYAGASFLYGVPEQTAPAPAPPPKPSFAPFTVGGQSVAGSPSSGPSYTHDEYSGPGTSIQAQTDSVFINASAPAAIALAGGQNYVKAVGSSAIDLGTGSAQVSIDAQGAPAWDLIKGLAVGDLVALWAPPAAPGLVPSWGPNSTLVYGASAISVIGVPEADLQAGFGQIGGENVLLLGRTQ